MIEGAPIRAEIQERGGSSGLLDVTPILSSATI
jgi:hypothetical protein